MANKKRLVELVAQAGDNALSRHIPLTAGFLATYLLANDVEAVVRCEKCRYYEKAEYDNGYKMVCRLLKQQTAYNGFCHCGERREEE